MAKARAAASGSTAATGTAGPSDSAASVSNSGSPVEPAPSLRASLIADVILPADRGVAAPGAAVRLVRIGRKLTSFDAVDGREETLLPGCNRLGERGRAAEFHERILFAKGDVAGLAQRP